MSKNKNPHKMRGLTLLRRGGSNLRPPCGGYETTIDSQNLSPATRLKTKIPAKCGALICCEGRDRTSDLRVMSPTSYRCSTSRCGLQMYVGDLLAPNKY